MSKPSPDFVYPPDYEKARIHKLANRIFKGKDYSDQECECCHRKVGVEEVETECNIDPKQLSFLGPGVPLYFLFVRAAIILLALMTLIYSIYGIASNASQNGCEANPKCTDDGFNDLAIVNKQNQHTLLSIQLYLSLVYMVVVIVYFHFLRAEARKLEEEVDQIVDSPSDYAIILRRLPQKVTEDQILEMVDVRRKQLSQEEKEGTQDLKVVKVILSFGLRQHLAVKAQNKAEWIKCVEENRQSQYKAKTVPTPSETSQIAIVIFQNQKSKDLFIHKPTILQSITQFFCTPCLPLSELEVRGQRVGIERAPEPDQIYWQNAGITQNGAIVRRMGFGLLSFLTLCVGGIVQYGLAVLNKEAKTDGAKIFFRIFNPLFVVLWSQVIILVIVHLTQKQRNQTVTQFQATLLVKMTLLQFLNAGVFVVLTKILASISTFDLGGGVLGQVTIIMCLNVVLPNTNNFVRNYLLATRRLQLFCVRKGCIIRSQMEVNKLTQGPLVNMPRRYAYILKTLLLTALYSPSVPVIIPIGLVGVTLAYFLQKLLQTSRYGIPHNISSMTWKSSIELIEYYLITFSLGQIVGFLFVYNWSLSAMPTSSVVILFICLTLAVLNSALPMEFFNQIIFQVEPSPNAEVTYTEIEERFEVTYEKMNPAYRGLYASKKDIRPYEKEELVPVVQAKMAENAIDALIGAVTKNVHDSSSQNLMSGDKRSRPDIRQTSLASNKLIEEKPESKADILEISLITNEMESKKSINFLVSESANRSLPPLKVRKENEVMGSFATLLNSISNNDNMGDIPLQSKTSLKPEK